MNTSDKKDREAKIIAVVLITVCGAILLGVKAVFAACEGGLTLL